MATAEEIFAQMEENPEAYAEEMVCTIDPVTREITVPQSLQLFGVESDQCAKKIPFRCPKIVEDDVDLSTFKLRINYQNANGELDIYPVTDMQTDGDDIVFSWELYRKVTAYRGTIVFAFCAKKTDEDGTIIREWNTTVNKECKSLEGLEAEEAIVSQNPDILESILTRLDTLEAGGGGTGTGVPGKQVELRNSGTAIQWRYTGDTTWTDLVQISDITGPPGKDGTDGKDGEPGTPGKDGENGTPGTDGITPHIGDNGNWYIGDVDTGIKARGEDGDNGVTPHIGANGNWYIGEIDTGVTAQGADGYTPQKGVDYTDGTDGKSAYQYAQEGGYTGTEAEFAQKLAAEYPTDVQINGKSIVNGGVANIPRCVNNKLGVVYVTGNKSIWVSGGGEINCNFSREYDNRFNASYDKPISQRNFDEFIRFAMTDGKGAAWTDTEKTGAWERLSSIKTAMDEVAVAGAHYYLGELTELTITLPDDALPGQEITIVWYNGETPATLAINGNILDFDYASGANSRSEISVLWDGTYWSLLSNEQSVPVSEVATDEA